ncbi:hypothetical protein Zmor_003517 [Zophobas morio]|uniref:Uncharacterized protein n=1 Tax=Zophobas morio TaxID=2755281 RepID=A0AA38HLL5_9CUCU|nr:hypothetical protein Zmor_003517 [Zophobas morio]
MQRREQWMERVTVGRRCRALKGSRFAWTPGVSQRRDGLWSHWRHACATKGTSDSPSRSDNSTWLRPYALSRPTCTLKFKSAHSSILLDHGGIYRTRGDPEISHR